MAQAADILRLGGSSRSRPTRSTAWRWTRGSTSRSRGCLRSKNAIPRRRLRSSPPTSAQARQAGRFDADALTLAGRFWPGPLTVVVPVRRTVRTADRRSRDGRCEGAGSRRRACARQCVRVVHHGDEREPVRSAGRPDRRRDRTGVLGSNRCGPRRRTGARRRALDHRRVRGRASSCCGAAARSRGSAC